jgi:hypothetical protein
VAGIGILERLFDGFGLQDELRENGVTSFDCQEFLFTLWKMA